MISEFTLTEKKEAKANYKASLKKNYLLHIQERERLIMHLLTHPAPKKWQIVIKFFKKLN